MKPNDSSSNYPLLFESPDTSHIKHVADKPSFSYRGSTSSSYYDERNDISKFDKNET